MFQEVEVETEDGRVEIRQVPAARVVPGTEVIYVVDYSNVGDGPVDDVAITNPVPEQLLFVSGVGPLGVSEVSIDGEAFGDLSEFTVTEPDGQTRAAETRDVTHLRWNLPELPPGGTGLDDALGRRGLLYGELELARWLLHGIDSHDQSIVEDAVGHAGIPDAGSLSGLPSARPDSRLPAGVRPRP